MFLCYQLCSLVHLQRYTKSLSTLQSLVTYIGIFCNLVMLEKSYIMFEKFHHIYSLMIHVIMLGNFQFRI
jgi:hypothetical protein